MLWRKTESTFQKNFWCSDDKMHRLPFLALLFVPPGADLKKTRKTQLFSENPGGFVVFLPPGLATATLCSLSVGKSSNTDDKVKIPLIYIFLGELSSWQCWYLLFCPGRQFYFESEHQPQIWCPSSQMGQIKYKLGSSVHGRFGTWKIDFAHWLQISGQITTLSCQESLCSSHAFERARSSRSIPNQLVMFAPRPSQGHKVYQHVKRKNFHLWELFMNILGDWVGQLGPWGGGEESFSKGRWCWAR